MAVSLVRRSSYASLTPAGSAGPLGRDEEQWVSGLQSSLAALGVCINICCKNPGAELSADPPGAGSDYPRARVELYRCRLGVSNTGRVSYRATVSTPRLIDVLPTVHVIHQCLCSHWNMAPAMSVPEYHLWRLWVRQIYLELHLLVQLLTAHQQQQLGLGTASAKSMDFSNILSDYKSKQSAGVNGPPTVDGSMASQRGYWKKYGYCVGSKLVAYSTSNTNLYLRYVACRYYSDVLRLHVMVTSANLFG